MLNKKNIGKCFDIEKKSFTFVIHKILQMDCFLTDYIIIKSFFYEYKNSFHRQIWNQRR